ncbi:hypothetical protein J4Q44_G00374740 [Coregonus suidteri]|uniref:Uncharacterized protein n=1 Tax=Coregonus suidteri TaxID=861788 RepID=A0AAN8KLA0_9TELE
MANIGPKYLCYKHTLSERIFKDHILHTTQGLVNRAYVEELWELALSKTIAALRTHSSYCTDPDLCVGSEESHCVVSRHTAGLRLPSVSAV